MKLKCSVDNHTLSRYMHVHRYMQKQNTNEKKKTTKIICEVYAKKSQQKNWGYGKNLNLNN